MIPKPPSPAAPPDLWSWKQSRPVVDGIPQPPVPPPEECIMWLEKLLLEVACWKSAKDISKAAGGRADDRRIREIASDCTNIISGQKGYKHIKHATAEEITHTANWLESQGKKMIERSIGIRRRAHEVLG